MPRGMFVLVGLAACGPAPRVAVEVPLLVEGAPRTAPGFTISEATLHLEAVRFRAPDLAAVWHLPSLVPTAHAHPGHGSTSDVVGEWLGPAAVDLLAGGSIGSASVFTGEVAGSELDLGAGRVEVVGTLDDGARAFRFSVPTPGEVLGVAFATAVEAGAPPTWALRVDVGAMLAEMAPLVPADDAPWAPEGADANAWTFATVQHPHYAWESR